MPNTLSSAGNSPSQLAAAQAMGQAANRAAAHYTIADYLSRKAPNTRRRHAVGLFLFSDYLDKIRWPNVKAMRHFAMNVTPDSQTPPAPAAWQGITWGLLTGFTKWLLDAGYAIGTVNNHLSTLKVYADLATKAGVIPPTETAMIRAVKSYRRVEGKMIDSQRPVSRVGLKKAAPVPLTEMQAQALKTQPLDLPQGRRDRLLMCLLLDHGLRVGEVALLEVENFDLQTREFRFYRPKVGREQTHQMTESSYQAAKLYLEQDAFKGGVLMRGSRKGGKLTEAGWSTQKMTARVKLLGERIGVTGLSAHDCRHYWATQAARSGTPLDRLQDAGGWASPAMPMRYIEAAKIANEGVKLRTTEERD